MIKNEMRKREERLSRSHPSHAGKFSIPVDRMLPVFPPCNFL